MKKLSFVVLVAVFAFAGSLFAQETTKPATQEKPKTEEVKKNEVKKEETKAEVKKATTKVVKKHHKKTKKSAPKSDASQ
jgi:Na+-transporting methylmalonyl-CoA/oxaloacetate decarboxylase gamma subunit